MTYQLGDGRDEGHAEVDDAVVQQEGRQVRRGAQARVCREKWNDEEAVAGQIHEGLPVSSLLWPTEPPYLA